MPVCFEILKIYLISSIFFFSDIFIFAQSVEIPIIDYVTVNQLNSLPVIHWSVSDPSQINGYGIKRFIRSFPSVPNNTWHTIRQIDNPYTVVYEDNSISYGIPNTNIQSEIYKITAYKITGSDTLFSLPSEKHQTIYLTGTYDYCSNQITLKWNNYIGWGNAFMHYELFSKENNGTYSKIAEKSFNDTIFIQSDLNYNSNYSYYIKAVRDDGISSLSNLKLVKTSAINFPTFLNINSAIIVNNSNYEILFYADQSADVKKYDLYKSNSYSTNYLLTDELLQDGNSTLQFIDKNLDISKKAYYFIAAVDYCGNRIFYSDTISNIVLFSTASSDIIRINSLKWDDRYQNSYYQIYRSINNNDFKFLADSEDHNYDDNVQSVYENQFDNETVTGKICYFVEMKTDSFINRSNISCAKQDEKIFLPNAFNPKSTVNENRVFKPKAAFISDYELVIYGSFGDVLFESKNPDFGWDGTLKNGKLAPVSSYLYILKYKNAQGKNFKLKKYVTLVY